MNRKGDRKKNQEKKWVRVRMERVIREEKQKGEERAVRKKGVRERKEQ